MPTTIESRSGGGFGSWQVLGLILSRFNTAVVARGLCFSEPIVWHLMLGGKCFRGRGDEKRKDEMRVKDR